MKKSHLNQRSQIFTWRPHASLIEEINSIEKNLIWALGVTEWEILITLKQLSQTQTQTSSLIQQQQLLQLQQQFPPSFTLNFRDMNVVTTAVNRGSAENLITTNDVSVEVDDSLSSTVTASTQVQAKAAAQLKTTQWKCHGRKYLLRLDEENEVLVLVGTIDKGANVQPVLEIVYTEPCGDYFARREAVADDMRTPKQIDQLLELVAFNLISPQSHASIVKAMLPYGSISIDARTQQSSGTDGEDISHLTTMLKVRALRWIHAVTHSNLPSTVSSS